MLLFLLPRLGLRIVWENLSKLFLDPSQKEDLKESEGTDSRSNLAIWWHLSSAPLLSSPLSRPLGQCILWIPCLQFKWPALLPISMSMSASQDDLLTFVSETARETPLMCLPDTPGWTIISPLKPALTQHLLISAGGGASSPVSQDKIESHLIPTFSLIPSLPSTNPFSSFSHTVNCVNSIPVTYSGLLQPLLHCYPFLQVIIFSIDPQMITTHTKKQNSPPPILTPCPAPLLFLSWLSSMSLESSVPAPFSPHPLDVPWSSYKLSCSSVLCILSLFAFKTILDITPLGTLSCNQNSLPPLYSLFIYSFICFQCCTNHSALLCSCMCLPPSNL